MIRSTLIAIAATGAAQACTNILVSKGASDNGATRLAYNADEESLFGSIGHYPAGRHAPGTKRDVWDWDGSFYLGQIDEANETYNVVGNANEHGLVIGETTFGGLPELDGHGTGALIDYGSLIWITLQRAKTAREAIHTMDLLVQRYGYASDGESFSIADPEEIWLMEMIGKGKEKGAVWVARRVPDGYITSTANQARIRTFPTNSPTDALYSSDVMSFAQRKGLYPYTGTLETFSFSDTYDPVTFTGARFCEARVWNIFQPACGGMEQHLDYAQGFNLTNRMPLFVKPRHKLSLNETMNLMRTHFENTWFDNRNDVGAESGHSPYRWRPLMWKSKGVSYVNERTVGTQQTGWTFVAESRGWMPGPMRALQWWAPDESSTAVRVPIWGGVTEVPREFAGPYGQMPSARVENHVRGDAVTMTMDSAFWVYNLVANMVYGERSIETTPIVHQRLHEIQDDLFVQVQEAESKIAAQFISGDSSSALMSLNAICTKLGSQTVNQWRNFFFYLFARFRDGSTNRAPTQRVCQNGETAGCVFRPVPDSFEQGYDQGWYDRIVKETGTHYLAGTGTSPAQELHKLNRLNKRRPVAPTQ